MLKKIKKIVKNYSPPAIVLFTILLLPLLAAFLKNLSMSNDGWFLLNHGRYIFDRGFPHIEPFTIHSNLSFVMQQWLSASIFWIVYKYLGMLGITFLVLIIFIVINFFIYKLCMLISDNKKYLSLCIVCVFSVLLANFIDIRPQIFTYLILIIELYTLELYVIKKDKIYLYCLPILSLLLINLHASMWFMLFLFMLPYLIDSFKLNLKFISGEGYNKKPLFAVLGLMLAVGFLNPYGIDSIMYVFKSYGIDTISKVVAEMRPLFEVSLISFLIIIIFAPIYLCISKKNNIKLRYILLFSGTFFLAIKNYRNLPLFYIGTFFSMAFYLKTIFPNYKQKLLPKTFKVIYSILCIFIVIFSSLSFKIKFESQDYLKRIQGSVEHILKNYNKEEVIVYTSYSNGAYPQFRGLKTYIDPRAEIFLKLNNKKEDILLEYYNLQIGNLDCVAFLNKYDFDLLILFQDDALNDIAKKYYKEVYKDKYGKVYEKIK